MSPILIRRAMVLTLDDADRPIEAADILIENGGISAIGDLAGAALAPGTRLIEGRGRLAAPGLINAHMHSQSATLAGFADRVSHPAFMWLTQAHTARRTPEEIRLAVLLSAIQMLTTGTTAAIDHFPGQRFTPAEMDAVLSAWEESGMRILLGMRFFDAEFGDILPRSASFPAELIRQAEAVEVLKPQPLAELKEIMPEVIARWHGRAGRLAVAPAPSNPDRCTDEALAYCAGLAAAHDLAIHTHLMETRRQAEIAQERYGETTLAHLDRLGILSDRWSCAHSIWLDDDDIARMAAHRMVAVHNPESNSRIGAGLMRTPDMLKAGVPIALGTDGAGANDNLVLHEAMRAAATAHRHLIADRRDWVSARDALAMATAGGAKALRQAGRIGVLQPGARADLVLYRLDTPSFTPLNDPVAQLVFAETGGSVDLVMVEGRVLVEEGRVTAFDAAGVMTEIDAMMRALRRRNADLFAVAEAVAEKLP